MGNLGLPEILIILLFILIFFGAKKIPDIAQGLGKGIKEFKKATRDVQEEIQGSVTAVETAARGTDRAAAERTTCFYCNSTIAAGTKFCPVCGKSLQSPACPKCGSINPLGNKFCRECGEKLMA